MRQQVLVADDHPVFGTALAMIVAQAEPEARIVSVANLAEAEAAARTTRFDLVLLDLMLPDAQGMSGLLLMRRLLPDAACTIVSGREEIAIVRQAADCGAQGFIPKSTSMDVMVSAIKALLLGGQWFPDGARSDPPVSDQPSPASRFADLSTAQLRVLRAAANGRLNKQIADDLGLAEATIKSHLAAIFRKLEVVNRTQAILAFRTLDPSIQD